MSIHDAARFLGVTSNRVYGLIREGRLAVTDSQPMRVLRSSVEARVRYDDWLTVPEAMQYAGIGSEITIYQMIERGEVAAVKVAGRWRINPSTIERRERPQDLLTVKEASQQLGLATSTIHSQIAWGKLRAHKINNRTYLEPEEVERYAREHRGKNRINGIAQLARKLKVSERTIYNRMERGLIPARKEGEHWVIDESYLDELTA